ncbi:MAG: DUF1643 domain-containing protein [Armatimonadaceae bacterium]
MKCTAEFDSTGQYRYRLTRCWDDHLPRICFVMLNPSTADAEHDDPTIRRCIGFSQRWGYGSLEVVNLFAYRATLPANLFAAPDPIGPENDRFLCQAVAQAHRVVAAWGVHGARSNRAASVLPLLGTVYCLGCTQSGEPRHPLYLPADTTPHIFVANPENPERSAK